MEKSFNTVINITYNIEEYPSGFYVFFYLNNETTDILTFKTLNEAQIFITKQQYAIEQLAKRTEIPEPIKQECNNIQGLAEFVFNAINGKYSDVKFSNLSMATVLFYRAVAIGICRYLNVTYEG